MRESLSKIEALGGSGHYNGFFPMQDHPSVSRKVSNETQSASTINGL